MIALLLAVGAAAVEPKLDQVLARAAAYVRTFERRLSGLVGEETYLQTSDATRIELRSHLLLLRNGGAGYLQYRDVYEVDGKAVGDRAERFSQLFGDSSASAAEQQRRILEESARYNIGGIYREMNVPLLALEFLSEQNQWRFAFKRTNDVMARVGDPGDTPPGTFRLSTDVWVIQYEEREPRTIIRTTDGKDLKSRGRLWVEADTGRVMMTELITRGRGLDASVNVSFQSEPLLGILVPIEMRERYRGREGSRIDAIATYGKFQPFSVK